MTNFKYWSDSNTENNLSSEAETWISDNPKWPIATTMQRKKHKLRFPAVRHTKTHDIFGLGTSKSSDRPAVFDVSHESDETFVDTDEDGPPATFGPIQHSNKDGDKKSDANFYDDYFADFRKCEYFYSNIA
ncbi:hypothetical protein Ddc_06405 [Ditylenchus destructor]|nr:hypothetical protein Ddc_06405 [Ditylenchus destructor]